MTETTNVDEAIQEGTPRQAPASSNGLVAAQQSISNPARFNVVLEGTTLPGYDILTTKAQLALLFKRNIEFAGRLLNGHAITIKSGVDAFTGQRYVDALRRAGANASLQPETLELDANVDAAFMSPPGASSSVRPPTASAQPAGSKAIADPQEREEYYKAAIGPENQDFYLRYFARRDAGGSAVSWHWPACFVAWYWLLYRKMWGLSWLYLALSFVPVIANALSGKNSNEGLVGLNLLWLVLAWAMFPMFASALYYNSIRRKIAEVRAISADHVGQLAILTTRGGTSNAATYLGTALALIAFVGVIAAIVLPAYQDYVIRSKMTEAVASLAACKTSVEEFVAAKNAWPQDAKDAGCSTVATDYVASLEVRARGMIVVTTRNTGSRNGAVASACVLALTPHVENYAIAGWSGSSAGCDRKYAPSNFR